MQHGDTESAVHLLADFVGRNPRDRLLKNYLRRVTRSRSNIAP